MYFRCTKDAVEALHYTRLHKPTHYLLSSKRSIRSEGGKTVFSVRAISSIFRRHDHTLLINFHRSPTLFIDFLHRP